MALSGLKPVVRLVPDWTEVDALLAGLPEQPFARGEACLDELVTNESHIVSALTGECVVRFKPTEKLIRAVAAVRARYGDGVVIHGDSPSGQSAKVA